jgi:hypothetical protein
MTCVTVRQFADAILGHELSPELELVGRRHIAHVEHLFPRPHVALGVSVTVQAPFHLQRALFSHQRHLVDGTMACRTADAFGDVNAVVEIREVWKIVDPRPRNRPVGAEAFAHGLEECGVGEYLRMTVHADLRRRDAGEARRLDSCVTVAAVDAVAGHVALVAELDRLLAGHIDLRDPRRAIDLIGEVEKTGDEEKCAEDTDPGYRVRAAMKNLRHIPSERPDRSISRSARGIPASERH